MKSEEKFVIVERLENLRVSTQLTWAEIGTAIGLSESMIYQVKSGARRLSPKALHRLAAAEREAGLAPPLIHDFERAASFREKLEVMRRATDLEALQLAAPSGKQAITEARVEYILVDLEPLLREVESLADLCPVILDMDDPEFKDFLKMAKEIKRKSLRFRSAILDLERTVDAIREIEGSDTPKAGTSPSVASDTRP